MRKNLAFRAWFYFRQGWSTYFAFILAAINTLTVTYYLAIERLPDLKIIFPSFSIYLAAATIIGIPILVFIGYVHYKRSSAYEAEADINVEAYPYWYKLPPGWNKEVVFPFYLMLIDVMLKLSKNEKLNEDDIKKISELKNTIDALIKGGNIGLSEKKDKT